MDNKAQLQNIAQTLGLPTELHTSPSRTRWIKTNTLNGLFFELESVKRGTVWRLIIEYGNPENSAIIIDGLPHLELTLRGGGVWFTCGSPDELLEVATEIKDFLLSEGLSRQGRRTKRQTSDDGYFEGAAEIIKTAVKTGFWHILDRNSLGFDAHDSLITVGKSTEMLANPDAPQWREHIVPCTMIIEEAVSLFEAGQTIPVVAQMLKINLAIVVITAEEAKRLDAVYQTTMPEGWNFGDDIFARLDAMGINY